MKTHAHEIHDVNPQMPRIFLQGAGRFWALETRKGRKGFSLLQTKRQMKLRSRNYDAGNLERVVTQPSDALARYPEEH